MHGCMQMLEPMDVADTDFLDADDKKSDGDEEGSSSSPDSGISKYYFSSHATASNRLFGRQKPIHVVLGNGKLADIILWRNKQISGGILGGATILWILFEWMGSHLLTFVCHSLILSLLTLFFWSNLASCINIPPPKIPKLVLPDDLIARFALTVRCKLNQGTRTFREVAAGKSFKKFLLVTLTLWIVSIVGGWFDFLTLVYLAFVILMTVPMVYEMHEDTVDSAVDKVLVEIKRQCEVLDKLVLRRFPAFNKDY